MEEIQNTETLEKEIEKTCKLYQEKIDNPSFELKKYIVSKWVEKININDEGDAIAHRAFAITSKRLFLFAFLGKNM